MAWVGGEKEKKRGLIYSMGEGGEQAQKGGNYLFISLKGM